MVQPPSVCDLASVILHEKRRISKENHELSALSILTPQACRILSVKPDRKKEDATKLKKAPLVPNRISIGS